VDRYRQVFLAFSAPFGLVVGSFLNVCIFRLPRNCMSIVRPRSRCTRCLNLIAWYDNIPVISYLLLGGKCRHCRNPISARYPLVELLTAVLFTATAYRYLYGPGDDEMHKTVAMFAQLYVLAALVVASFIDIDFRILPHEITISGIIVSIVAVTAFPFLHEGSKVLAFFPNWPNVGGFVSAGFGGFIGGGVIYIIGVLGEKVFKKEAMGMGDVWYFAFLGAYLGALNVLVAFVLACLFGSIIGIVRFFFTKDHYIPFGPFLSLGALAMIFFSKEVYKLFDMYQNWIRSVAN
jgi:leader peptidase (prepilin peptidase)/N-methyltransferase